MIMSKETLIKSIREIPDFPIPGILFYDVTTLFKDPWCLQELSNIMFEMYKDKGITKVVGIESRGFIMGAYPSYPTERRFYSYPQAGQTSRRGDRRKLRQRIWHGHCADS